MSRSAGGGVDPRWDDPVAGWKLKEYSDGSGAVPRADVLGVYELTDTNTTASAAGIIGNGASIVTLDTNYLSNAALSFTGGSWTLVTWFKPTDLDANRMLLGCETANTGFRVEARIGGNATVGIYDAAGSLSLTLPVAFTAGNWTMLTLWSDGVKTYGAFNGGGTTEAAKSPAANTGLNLGTKLAPSTYVNGVIDETYIFSTAKDAAWRTDMYNAGAGRSYPS